MNDMWRWRCLERYSLMGMILTLPLNHLPLRYSLPVQGQNGSMYFFILALLAMAAEKMQGGRFSIPYRRFWILWMIWPALCLALGIAFYPYPLDESAVEHVRSFQLAQLYFPAIFHHEEAVKLWIFASLLSRLVKSTILPVLGIYLLLFHLYQSDWKAGVRDVTRPACVLAVLMGFYSIPEIIWLVTGNETCGAWLTQLNSYLYDAGMVNGWWPPALWKGQLRSLTAEPSFFGIIAAFLIPCLWYRLEGKRHYGGYVFLTYFLFMLFMTKARTGLVIYLGELVLLVGIGFLFRFDQWKRICLTAVCTTCLAFFLSTVGVPYIQSFYGHATNEAGITSIDAYIDENVSSVAGIGSRSNGARYGNTLAAVRTGLDHPVFGVGQGLENMYMKDRFPSFAEDNQEVKKWTEDMLEKGFLFTGYPVLNQYAFILAWNGLPGLILFLAPVIFVISKVWKKRALVRQQFSIICVGIALAGQLATMMSNTFFYTYPISLALLYCMILGNEKKDKAEVC